MSGVKRKGFGLVELLAALSVISLLMVILVWVLATARSQACGAICQANLRQLFLANMGYILENDGHDVPAADIMSEKGGKWRWHGVAYAAASKKILVAIDILCFDFELFIGDRYPLPRWDAPCHNIACLFTS